MKQMFVDRRPGGGLMALAVAIAAASILAAPAEARARHAHLIPPPVVVELYTAQGCDTCPEANGLIDDLAKRPEVLPLTFSVDYWDYLGWADTFAKSEFTDRQQAFDRKLKVRELYTPEAVVQGAAEASGLESDKVDALVEAQLGRKPPRAPQVALERRGTRLAVSTGALADPAADLWLVRYDPASRAVKIKAGDNKGKTVMVRNAVRELLKLGVWTGGEKRYAVPPAAAAGLRSVLLLQLPRGGRILHAIPLVE